LKDRIERSHDLHSASEGSNIGVTFRAMRRGALRARQTWVLQNWFATLGPGNQKSGRESNRVLLCLREPKPALVEEPQCDSVPE
jgi:hypothetical protein